MIEYSEKYKSYAEEFPDAIVCWKEPAENHTEEGEKIIEAYHQNYLVIAHEIMYEVGDMLAGLCGDDTIQKIYDSYIFTMQIHSTKKLDSSNWATKITLKKSIPGLYVIQMVSALTADVLSP